jgi:cysteine desulfurase
MVGSIQASHVLLAMGVNEELARATVRFSLGRETSPEAIEGTLEALGRVLSRQSRHA